MILDELIVENFGVFGGRHSIQLAPKSKKRRIVVVGGLNGRGKTTILDAVQIALYGNRSRPSKRGTLGYETYLERAWFREALPDQPYSVELAFSIQESGTATQYRVRRSWRRAGRSLKETIDVSRDGVHDRALTATWPDHIEELLPLEISSLFFFDGEKIEALADPTQASSVVAAAIDSLLGLGLIERLQRDLTVIGKRKQDEFLSGAEVQDLTQLASAVELASAKALAAAEAVEFHTNALDLLTSSLASLEEEARREGGDLFERRAELEQQKIDADTEVRVSEVSLRELAGGALPLSLCQELLGRLVKERGEPDQIESGLLQALLETRDGQVLSFLENLLPEVELAAADEFLTQDRIGRTVSLGASNFLPSRTVLRAAHSALEQISEARESMIEILANRDQGEELGSALGKQLAGVPTGETIGRLLERRDRVRNDIEAAKRALTLLEEAETTARTELTKHETAYERSRQSAALEQLRGKDAGRIIEHASKVRDTLDRLKAEVRQRSIKKIELQVLQCYRKLLGKENLVAGLKFDLETCTPTLTTKGGEELHIEGLSAGERQLFAVALLWGLALVSGRALPTIVDTPLGRLDSVHRRTLVDRYFPHAAQQVILLSTDKEIDRELAECLEPATGRWYRLEYSEELRSTEILPGYFFEGAQYGT